MFTARRIFVLIIIGISFLRLISSERCERVKIGNDYYKRSLVANIDGFASNIVVDPRTDNLFFQLNKRKEKKGLHIIKHGSLGAKEIPIADDVNGQCVAVDVKNNIIYIGTNQGILIYDDVKNEVGSERPIGDDDVKNIFFDTRNNQMYLTTGVSHEIFKFVNNSASNAVKHYERVPKAYNFVVDGKGNAFYEYLDGRLYFFSHDLFEPILYKGLSKELKYVIRINERDEVVVSVKNYFYSLTTDTVLPKRIADVGFKITSFAYDFKGNIIVGGKNKIYRYKPLHSNDPCTPDDYFMANI